MSLRLALGFLPVLTSCATLATNAAPVPRAAPTARAAVAMRAEGTSSTPGAFQLPQMGFVSFRCDRSWRVQPFFDTHGATAEEQVTVRAHNITVRNFTTRVVGHSHGRPLVETSFLPEHAVALPYAHYGTVTFTLSTGSEARALNATVTAQFIAGTYVRKGYPPLAGCYVRHWLIAMSVSPYG